MKTDTKHEITNITRERHCSALYLAYASGMGCPHAHRMAWNGIYPTATLLLFNIGWSHDVRIHTLHTDRTDGHLSPFLFFSLRLFLAIPASMYLPELGHHSTHHLLFPSQIKPKRWMHAYPERSHEEPFLPTLHLSIISHTSSSSLLSSERASILEQHSCRFFERLHIYTYIPPCVSELSRDEIGGKTDILNRIFLFFFWNNFKLST
ncbi:hypothetical protein M430DRAFT_168349 [Amorphotheca resinae ATCC 22711]|uniref:Uncharacterized protein n=1 Tax=Amorphotheca resinae ATCC 22711 TaxID=857342 RepID=A0A2T3AU81_AMORE|nr:hypothetical protein M430DRAFT_168349 [Amorphotheca resinae ATCC 22711]PSS12227.1 hypothetical protein M430DRAFT_168349 [Amorphotheca resinae ATCC 22711]